MLYYSYYASPVGLLCMETDGDNLTGLYFAEGAKYDYADFPVFTSVRNWLDAYFSGQPYVPDFPIHLVGTFFQLQVWDLLKSIPYGKTITYGDIAREIALQTGREKMSSQAVGQAVGRNPVSIIIPCHRVVGSGKRLTGYAGGLDKKRWLLLHEGILDIK